MDIKACDVCEKPLRKRYYKLLVSEFEKAERGERYVKGGHQTFTVCEKCLEKILEQLKKEAEENG